MDPLVALAVLASLLLLTGILAVVQVRRSRFTRRYDAASRQTERVDPAELGVSKLGDRATIVQFSTDFCARCPSVRRAISELVAGTASVEFVHVDLTHRPQLASKYRLLQTPTVLILDDAGVPRSRLSGAITRDRIAHEMRALFGDPHA